nr:hypothetical protein [uncultured Treponema sp.]
MGFGKGLVVGTIIGVAGTIGAALIASRVIDVEEDFFDDNEDSGDSENTKETDDDTAGGEQPEEEESKSEVPVDAN